ncbi:YrhK family protein [Ornithinicoccus halotolerans]|uniref:YrhK family protein n=1 Tax=Ornithinicoccus halotolerans TaxID=1748220 RepID=UPI0012981266|nr:YrhK family protein [Ornithinicoccus halotolerans]
MPRTRTTPQGTLRLLFRYRELDIKARYETLSIANDVFIALCFVAGSAMFYAKPLETWAITLFLLGSVFFLARPAIRLARHLHLSRRADEDDGSAQDF